MISGYIDEHNKLTLEPNNIIGEKIINDRIQDSVTLYDLIRKLTDTWKVKFTYTVSSKIRDMHPEFFNNRI